MAWATGSPPAEGRRHLPRLWLVFAAVGALAFLLALAGLIAVRVWDDQLIRQTEGELLGQGAAVGEAFRALLQAEVGEAPYGVERSRPWPFPTLPDSQLVPLLPSLRASDPVHPPPGDAPPSPVLPEWRAEAAGAHLSPLLSRVSRHTLAGLRVVDVQGVVVATSSTGLGTTLAHREEVQRALRGEPYSLLRQRHSEPGEAPLASLSRDSGVRVTVALPVLEGERVWGAVVLSRTPMTLAKALYADRWNLTATGLVLLAAIALASLAAAALVGRPVRALVRQTRAIAANAPEGFSPLARPAVAELAELSEALARMAGALRERNAYIRSFAANVSHEFKTPLSSIQGAVELLQESASAMTEEQRARFLGNIALDARRLTRLVQGLLELARADAMVATPATTRLSSLLPALAERARAEGLPLEVPAVPEGLTVPLPAEVLEAVLWQLATNARQHGGEDVRVRVEVEEAEGCVRLVVRDGGPGISEANRARIFDAFFTTARARGGTGMGLTIARSMLRACGGELELLPPDGPGAAFAVSVPP